MSSCSRYTTFLLFGSLFHSTKLTYTPTLSAIYALTPYQIEVSLHVDVSENTLPFVNQSINNFSDWHIRKRGLRVSLSQSLSPHVLLIHQVRCHRSLFHNDSTLLRSLWRNSGLIVTWYIEYNLRFLTCCSQCEIQNEISECKTSKLELSK